MAKNTNPISKKLLIKQNWNTIQLPIATEKGNNIIYFNNYIHNLIHGTFFKLGILTTNLKISINCLGNVNISWLYYPLNGLEYNKSVRLNKLIKLIKLLIETKYPKYTYKFIYIKAPHKFVDSKILNNYVNLNLINDPNRFKFIINKLIKEFQNLNK